MALGGHGILYGLDLLNNITITKQGQNRRNRNFFLARTCSLNVDFAFHVRAALAATVTHEAKTKWFDLAFF